MDKDEILARLAAVGPILLFLSGLLLGMYAQQMQAESYNKLFFYYTNMTKNADTTVTYHDGVIQVSSCRNIVQGLI